MVFQHRLSVSADADRVAWPRPDKYDAADFELLQRALEFEGDAPAGAFFTALLPSSLPGYPGDTHFDAQHSSLDTQGFTRSNRCSVAPRLEEKVLPLLRHLRRRERPRRASSKRPSRPKPKGNGQPIRTRGSLAGGRTVEGA